MLPGRDMLAPELLTIPARPGEVEGDPKPPVAAGLVGAGETERGVAMPGLVVAGEVERDPKPAVAAGLVAAGEIERGEDVPGRVGAGEIERGEAIPVAEGGVGAGEIERGDAMPEEFCCALLGPGDLVRSIGSDGAKPDEEKPERNGGERRAFRARASNIIT
jgi:hypothetical protein